MSCGKLFSAFMQAIESIWPRFQNKLWLLPMVSEDGTFRSSQTPLELNQNSATPIYMANRRWRESRLCSCLRAACFSAGRPFIYWYRINIVGEHALYLRFCPLFSRVYSNAKSRDDRSHEESFYKLSPVVRLNYIVQSRKIRQHLSPELHQIKRSVLFLPALSH